MEDLTLMRPSSATRGTPRAPGRRSLSPSPATKHCDDLALYGPRSAELSLEPDGDFMQAHIRQHMTMILQPTAEHIREAHIKLQTVSNDLLHSRARADDVQGVIAGLHHSHTGLQATVAATSGRVDRTQSDLAEVRAAQASLEVQLEAMRSMLGKDEQHMDTNTDRLDAVVDRLGQVAEQVDKLQATSARSSLVLEEQATSVTELHDFYKGLSYRAVETTKDLEQLSQQVAALDRSFKKHVGSLSHQQDEEVRRAGQLQDRQNSLFDVLGDTNRNLQVLSDRSRAHEASLAKLLSAVTTDGDSVAKVNQVSKRLGEVDAVLEEHAVRLDRLRASGESMRKEVVAEGLAASGQLHDLGTRVAGTAADLRMLEEVQTMLREQVKRADRTVLEVVKDHQAFKGQLEGLQREVLVTQTFKAETTQRLDAHAKGLQRKADQDDTLREVRDLGEVVHGLKEQLGGCVASLATMSRRTEAYARNLQGLSKGFEDVHRQVVLGEHGLLAPRPTSAGYASTVDTLGGTGGSLFSSTRATAGSGLPTLRPSTAGNTRQHR